MDQVHNNREIYNIWWSFLQPTAAVFISENTTQPPQGSDPHHLGRQLLIPHRIPSLYRYELSCKTFIKLIQTVRALAFMQRKMTSSGIERMIKQEQRFHIKNSEKRVLARKSLERRLRSEDLARKLKSIMIKKVRGL
ncbi:hypothetical protein P8452_25020 [Trifolium repens]|nr:hypothetical protein P8452_25020 [Trifolium repens]